MPRLPIVCLVLALFASRTRADDAPAVSEHAAKLHAGAIVVDGHNDLPWRLRTEGDVAFGRIDIAKRLAEGHTDIPRLREGGVDAQFWSVFIPSEHANPARTVIEQIDLVHRMIARYPDDLMLALSADDIERAAADGKIASMIGIEGGVAIENRFAMLRAFHTLGARYMTLTHNTTLDWADAATDTPRHDGLSPFGERVVREMNRLGMLVDISHVSPATMADALRVSKAPVIASHSSAFAIAAHPRNVPDDMLKAVAENGGVVMVNFFSGFIVPEYARQSAEARQALRREYPDPEAFAAALDRWYKSHKFPRGDVSIVADHIDHIVKVAGIDHVGLGGDYDGVTSTPEGLDDVSTYPRLTDELLRRGYSDVAIRKLLGANLIRAFRRAGDVAMELQAAGTPPEVDEFPAEPKH